MRQGYVLSRLLADNLITLDEYEAAKSESIKYQKRKKSSQIGSHFIEHIRKEVVSRLGEDRLLRGGLKIYTTLDMELQKASEGAINLGVLDIDRRQGFSAPLANLSSDEDKLEFIKKTQDSFKEKFSNYFVIDKNFTRKLELNEIFDDLGGVINNPLFISRLKTENYFKAFVTRTDDDLGIVFVNIFGVEGFINVSDMEWAKQRNLQTSTYWKQPLRKPSEVLREGDVVFVTYIGDSINGLKVNNDLAQKIKK